jgi:hypothetical protein
MEETIAKCPNCNQQCIAEWQYNYSPTKQRMTQERLWRCTNHNLLYRFYGGKLEIAFPNIKVYYSEHLKKTVTIPED